jgi:hypothetical protein
VVLLKARSTGNFRVVLAVDEATCNRLGRWVEGQVVDLAGLGIRTPTDDPIDDQVIGDFENDHHV